ncbi:hypothetical protein F442_08749 [Phytophthora nicotianae P10297]|uniref:ZSWIM1/3 RNaseH-like domain-containing protein n=1 Tax=Phytophthora nicotianae P10297 TaxID=1317064 RepID=W2ZBK6_PHYNI|nr:hypothetical protein F442_08749 [Phytophthora nicotianae P10297]
MLPESRRLQLPALRLMVMDGFGYGQFVQHSNIESNVDWHMKKALDHIKTANINGGALQVVMVDKDMEIHFGVGTL